MMPVDTGEVEDTETTLNSRELRDVKEQTNHRDSNNFLNLCIPTQDSIVEDSTSLYNVTACEISLNEVDPSVSCDKSTSSIHSNCLPNTSKIIYFDSEVFGGQYIRKSLKEVEACSVKDLKLLIRDLSKAVEKISSQLVQLLVENDALQQESDARNIAIEQLLRITVKETENELKPVQMSVILTSENI